MHTPVPEGWVCQISYERALVSKAREWGCRILYLAEHLIFAARSWGKGDLGEDYVGQIASNGDRSQSLRHLSLTVDAFKK